VKLLMSPDEIPPSSREFDRVSFCILSRSSETFTRSTTLKESPGAWNIHWNAAWQPALVNGVLPLRGHRARVVVISVKSDDDLCARCPAGAVRIACLVGEQGSGWSLRCGARRSACGMTEMGESPLAGSGPQPGEGLVLGGLVGLGGDVDVTLMPRKRQKEPRGQDGR
jgi:hypothetical protein